MKHIIYICNTRFPTEKAHGLSTVKICEAFSKGGYTVDLIVPKLWIKVKTSIFSHYNINKTFKIRSVGCIDFFNLFHIPLLERLTFLIQIFSFSFFSIFYILKWYNKKERKDLIFMSHDYIPLYFASYLGKRIFYDIHHFPGKNFMYKRVMRVSFGFAVQTKWKIQELNKEFNIPNKKIIYWPNGTDVKFFDNNISQDEARKMLDLPLKIPTVLYTGQLFDWKGVDTLIKTIDYLKSNVNIYIVGGSEYDVFKMKSYIPQANDNRINFVNFRPHNEIPLWLCAADVLVLPNTGKQKVSLYYTSPMKLFEYMACGVPIVASKIPSIMEILNAENSVLVTPDNPRALAEGIESVLEKKLVNDIGKKAQEDVKEFTWDKRAEKMISYFDKHE